MPILEPFPLSSMLGVPFADYLNVTTPLGNEQSLLEKLVPLFESLGPIEAQPEEGFYKLYSIGTRGGTLAFVPTGVFKLKVRGKVFVISASGGALAAMRSKGVFSEYLSILSEAPHRVSMLHATQDYHVASPSASVLCVKAAAIAGEVSLTRKRLLPGQVRSLLQVNPEGEETGTVYLGNRANADVWAKVYDKREERRSRGAADPGPIVRVEIAVQSDVGATLKDAHDPASIFFHFAGRSLVAVPPQTPSWVAHGEGFVSPPRVERLLVDQLDSLFEFSRDLERLVTVAVGAYGAKAGDVLARRLRARCEAAQVPA